MIPLEDGFLIKNYSLPDTEIEAPLQTTLSQVSSEDPRLLEKPAPSLEEEFLGGSKVFFLGEQAYGVAVQVCGRSASPGGEECKFSFPLFSFSWRVWEFIGSLLRRLLSLFRSIK